MRSWMWMALMLAGLGCTPDEPLGGAYEPPPGCNPLAPTWDCTAPYPSDVFRGEDCIALSGAARIEDVGAPEPVDPLPLRRPDGFPTIPAIVVALPGGIDDQGWVFHDEPAGSVGNESPTLVLDVERGERVVHFAELDPAPGDDAAMRALTIRPLVPLRPGARYVVAVRGATVGGARLEAPEGFRRLRDQYGTDHPALAELAGRYEADVFAPLVAQGLDRRDLQLAWDFTVATEQSTTGRMRALRDDALARFAETPPAVTAVEVVDDPNPFVARVVRGTMTVPLYLDSAEPGGRLLPEGTPPTTVEAGFVVTIPPSVANRAPGSAPARLVQYGHGFFGTTDEAESAFLGETLDRMEAVAVATDWWGLSRDDIGVILGQQVVDSFVIVDRLHQAQINQLALTAAAQQTLPALAEVQVDDAPLYDPSEVYFYGISNGHILGSTLVALSPVIERAALGVGGVGYGFMLLRSQAFAALLQLFSSKVPDRIDIQVLASMVQTHFDPVDPVSYLPRLLRDTLPGCPPSRQVLLQYALGDHSVPNLGTELQARALGLPLLAPPTVSVPGLDIAEGPLPSAIVQFDFGVPEPRPGTFAVPPTMETAGHDGLRRTTAAMEQVDAFLRSGGQVVATCDGACDPE